MWYGIAFYQHTTDTPTPHVANALNKMIFSMPPKERETDHANPATSPADFDGIKKDDHER